MINYGHTWKRLRVPVFRDGLYNMYRNEVAGIIEELEADGLQLESKAECKKLQTSYDRNKNHI